MMKNTIIILILSTMTLLYSCSKDKELINSELLDSVDRQLIQNENGILTFVTQEDFANQIDLLNQMSYEELINFQENNNYQSYGLFCDGLYSQISSDSLNPTLVISNVASYSNYFELVPDNNESGFMSLEARFDGNPMYYIMNIDRMYIVEGKAYKLFEEGLVSTDIVNIDELISLDAFEFGEADLHPELDYFDDDIWLGTGTLTSPHDAGSYKIERATNGRDRTKAFIELSLLTSYPVSQFGSENFVRPFKRTMGIWYWCKRTITYSFNIAIDVHRNNGTYHRDHFTKSNTKYAGKINYIDVILGPDINDVEAVHYAGYNCFGDTPSTSPASFSKYVNNL